MVTSRTVVFVLPAYNEEGAIGPLVRRIAAASHHAPDGDRWQVIVVDDGSRDGTLQEAQAFLAAGEGLPSHAMTGADIHLVLHAHNEGLAAALRTGFLRALELQHAQANAFVLVMDADNTHDPMTVHAMVARASQADVVIASRYAGQTEDSEQGVPHYRKFLSHTARRVLGWIVGAPGVQDYTSGFRLYRSTLLKDCIEADPALFASSGFAVTVGLLLAAVGQGGMVAEVPTVIEYDKKPGRSKMRIAATIRGILSEAWRQRRARRRSV